MSRTIATAVILLLTTACGGGEVAPDTRPEVVKNLPPPLNCPEGVHKYGLATDQLEQWCETNTGKITGPYKSWHLSGNKFAVGQFHFGDAHGKWLWYYDNGKQQSTRSFVSGKDKGTWTSFTEDGKPQQQGDFLDGRATGTWVVYHSNGNIATEGRFHNGQKNGEWNWNDPTGERTKQEVWEAGRLVASTEVEPE